MANMANLAQSVAYAADAGTWEDVAAVPKLQKEARRKKKSKRLSQEDIEIVAALEAVKSDMEFLHNCFDHTTDATLIDSLTYELKAANLKYQYYINMCKEKGIVCDMPELRG